MLVAAPTVTGCPGNSKLSEKGRDLEQVPVQSLVCMWPGSLSDYGFQCAVEDRLWSVRSWLMDTGFGRIIPRKEDLGGDLELPSGGRCAEEVVCRAAWGPGAQEGRGSWWGLLGQGLALP